MQKLGFVSIVASAVLGIAAPAQANYVEAVIFRDYDQASGTNGYVTEFNIFLTTPGVSGVSISRDSVDLTPLLESDSPGEWSMESKFSGGGDLNVALNDAKAAMSAPWKVTVNHGASVSSLLFTLNLSGLTASSFADLAMISNPVNGASLPPGSVNFTWTPVADTFIAHGWLDSDSQSFPTERFAAGQGSWNPGDLNPGTFSFGIDYGDTSATELTNVSTSGDPFTWDTSPFAPTDWPAGTPLFAIISTHEIGFTVVPEPSALSVLLVSGLLLGRRKTGAEEQRKSA